MCFLPTHTAVLVVVLAGFKYFGIGTKLCDGCLLEPKCFLKHPSTIYLLEFLLHKSYHLIKRKVTSFCDEMWIILCTPTSSSLNKAFRLYTNHDQTYNAENRDIQSLMSKTSCSQAHWHVPTGDWKSNWCLFYTMQKKQTRRVTLLH